jgi:HAD superfamily hydrolase (TIGR01509 family)
MPVRAVLFDLGNTLWHIPDPPPVEQVRGETMRRVFGLLRSWGVDPQGDLRFLGRDIRLAVTAADRAAYATDCVSPDYVAIVQQVANGKGLHLDHERADELWHTWNLPGAFFRRRPLEGAHETLATLRHRGYRLGLVTNRYFAGPAFHDELAELGLDSFFEASAVSCDLGYMKPHEQIFRHVLDALDVVPNAAVMVGDDLRADIAGAQALGMTTVWLQPPAFQGQLDGIRPHFTVQALPEIPTLTCFDG